MVLFKKIRGIRSVNSESDIERVRKKVNLEERLKNRGLKSTNNSLESISEQVDSKSFESNPAYGKLTSRRKLSAIVQSEDDLLYSTKFILNELGISSTNEKDEEFEPKREKKTSRFSLSLLKKVTPRKLSDNETKSEPIPLHMSHSRASVASTEDIQVMSDSSSLSDNSDLCGPSMDGYTNARFEYDEETSFTCLQPKVFHKFGRRGFSFGDIGDASDILVLSGGASLVCDMLNSRILHFDRNGQTNVCYQTKDMVEPWAIDISSNGTIYVTSRKKQCVVRFLKSGEIEQPLGASILGCPSGVALDEKHGLVYVTDSQADLLAAFDMEGNFVNNIGNPMSPVQQLNNPRYVTVSPLGDIVVCDSGNHCLKIFDSEGNFNQKLGSRGKKEGQLKFPYGVCTDAFGNIAVADHYNNRVSYFSKSGEFIRHLAIESDGVRRPQGVYMTNDKKLYLTNGQIKATEVIVFDLRNSKTLSVVTDIVHV